MWILFLMECKGKKLYFIGKTFDDKYISDF